MLHIFFGGVIAPNCKTCASVFVFLVNAVSIAGTKRIKVIGGFSILPSHESFTELPLVALLRSKCRRLKALTPGGARPWLTEWRQTELRLAVPPEAETRPCRRPGLNSTDDTLGIHKQSSPSPREEG